ncbi:hypothetical protein ACS5PN_14970 [Roseateles sp. NT4]|uniref:hypothetical protein n=1 Tax=Roseateles sp. NT4 TaxID=3453715 RepID=UPI003EECF2A3
MKTLSALVLAALTSAASAQAPTGSDYMAWSLPTFVLSATIIDASGVPMQLTPQGLLATSTVLTVLGIYEEGHGFSWLLERPADGARFSVRMSGRLAEGTALAPMGVVFLTACSAGGLLSVGERVVGFIPNASGKALLHHERISG